MVVEKYNVFRGGHTMEEIEAELTAQGCEVIRKERNVMVHTCETHQELGDQITVLRFSKAERELYTPTQLRAFADAYRS